MLLPAGTRYNAVTPQFEKTGRVELVMEICMTDMSAHIGSRSESVTPAMLEALRSTGPWVRFLSILAFVGAGFMILVGALVIGVGLVAGGDEEMSGGLFAVMGLIYLVGAVLYIVGALHLFRYAGAIRRAVRHPVDLSAMEAALVHQKSFWKFSGIMAIIMLVVYVPGVLAAIAIPNLLTSMQRAKQKRTAADIQTIAAATEEWATDHNRYPPAGSMEELAEILQPEYIDVLPLVDGWGQPLHYTAIEATYVDHPGYIIASGGKNGELELPDPSRYRNEQSLTGTFDDDLVYGNRKWLQIPDGVDP